MQVFRSHHLALTAGNKAWLRRRLHGAIVRDHLDAAV